MAVFDLDDMLNSIEEWMVAKKEHDKACALYDGYSWDYAGFHCIEKLENARDAVRKGLSDFIRSEIKRIAKENENGNHTSD